MNASAGSLPVSALAVKDKLDPARFLVLEEGFRTLLKHYPDACGTDGKVPEQIAQWRTHSWLARTPKLNRTTEKLNRTTEN